MKTGVAPDQGTGSAMVNSTGLELVAAVTVNRGIDRASSRSADALTRNQSGSAAAAFARSVEITPGVNQMRGCSSEETRSCVRNASPPLVWLDAAITNPSRITACSFIADVRSVSATPGDAAVVSR